MDEAELAGLLGEHAARHSVPGAAVGLLRDGETVAAHAGIADATNPEPIGAGTRFAVGSLCKSMVATAVAGLVDRGGLSFDDTAAAHVPELCGAAWAERATIRDLLANRSRLPLRGELEFEASRADDLPGLTARLADGAAAPSIWSYSNAGWCVLGRVLETATGLPWEEAMRSEVLEPLGMDETLFVTDGVDVPCAAGHAVTEGAAVPTGPWSPRALAPAGSTLLSTLTDLVRFARAQLESPFLAELRATSAEVRIHGWLDAWCLGWARFDWEGGPVWGWDGLIAGQRSVLRLLPERRGALVLLTNCASGRALYRSLVPELMDGFFGVGMPALELAPQAGAAGDLSYYEGVYAWPDRRWEVEAGDGSLLLRQGGETRRALPIDARTFLVDPADPDTPTVTFDAFDDDGRPGALYEMLWAYPRSP